MSIFEENFYPLKLPFLLKLFLVLASIIMIGYLIKEGQLILAPLFTAVLLAIVSLPVTHFLEKKLRFKRIFSTLFCLVIVAGIIFGLIQFFASQFSDFGNDIPKLEKQILKSFSDLQSWVNATFHIRIHEQLKYLNDFLTKMLSSGGLIFAAMLGFFTSAFAFFFFTLLFYIFLLNYRSVFFGFLVKVFKSMHLPKVNAVLWKVQLIIKQYITGLLIQILIVSILTTTMLSIIGVEYAILLGVLTGLLNIIPYVGICISGLLASLIAFSLGDPRLVLFTLIGYAIVHVIDGNIILPFVVGSKVKINALVSFIGLLIGEKLWGISGMLLCIPALAILKVILDQIPETEAWGLLLGEKEAKLSREQKIMLKAETEIDENSSN